VNGKPRRVPEEDDDGEASAEYRAKFAVPDASSKGEVARLELERQLSATLAAQTERDQRLTQLIDELALKSALLEQAEANAAEATRRAGPELREQADRLLAQTSLVEQKDAELVNMQARLDEAQSPPQKATFRAADADERSEPACEQIGKCETELEARKELEADRLRLTDAENGCARNNTDTHTLRALSTAGLVSTNEDQITHGLGERIRTMKSEMASLQLSEKSSEEMQSRNEG
jgi:hypothetical protein